MKENIICFTKIDIVQLKVNGEITQELPTSDFLGRLKTAIENDVSKHQVSYDNNKDQYTIFHNGKKYIVYYGDTKIDSKSNQIDIIQVLNNLVTLSEEKKRKQEIYQEVEEKKQKSLKEIIKNGNDGIFYSEDDKLKYINHLKKELAKESIFSGLGKITDQKYEIDKYDALLKTMLIDLVGILVFSILPFITSIGYLFLGFVFCFIDSLCIRGGMNATLMSLIVRLFYRLGSYSSSIVNNIVSKINKKRKIKILSNSIIESELSEKMSEEVPITNLYTLKGETKDTIKRIASKLPLVKDKTLLKDYADRLEELIDECRDIPPHEYNKRYSDILFQLSYLDGEVSKEAGKELSTHVINSDFNKTSDVVESISSLQTGRAR